MAEPEELRRFQAVHAMTQPHFSVALTVWRRERDSNPRYRFRHSGFQDHPFQPLTHPSGPVEQL
jgi:hypothetical protein